VLAGCTLESQLATCSVSAAMSASKRRRFLSPSRISELVWDSESEEDTAASSESTSEDEGGLQDEPENVVCVRPGMSPEMLK